MRNRPIRPEPLFLALCLCTSVAFADVSNVTILGASPTQALVSYTAPDSHPCTIEVSESVSYAPLVNDVNPARFPNANRDDRPGNISSGRTRIFVVGKRAAEKGADGRFYSRALQLLTLHYVRISCGTATAVTTFRTANLALGNTYGETAPPDAGNLTFSQAGHYAWPSIDWTNPRQIIIDPQTGVPIHRATLPGERSGLIGGGFTTGLDPDSAWRNPGAAVQDDNQSASFAGPCPAGKNCYLYLRNNHMDQVVGGGADYPGEFYAVDTYQLTLKGGCSGACSGDNGKVQACLTIDGVHCYGASQELSLNGCAAGCKAPASPSAVLADWLNPGQDPFPRQEMFTRTGTVSVSGNTATVTAGWPFNYEWAGGATILLAPGGDACTSGSPYAITGFSTRGKVTAALLSSAPGDGTYHYCAPNFGVLIRKKTASPDTISVQYAAFSIQRTVDGVWPDGGFAAACASEVSTDGAGQTGYRCQFGFGLYWINNRTGDVRFLGNIGTGGQAAPDPAKGVFDAGDGWTNEACSLENVTFDGPNSTVVWCSRLDRSGRWIILKGVYHGDYSAVPSGAVFSAMPNVTWTNITPGSKGMDVGSLVQDFDPAFDKTKYGCYIYARQSHYLMLKCNRGGQDTLAWLAAFDTGNGGILGAGGTGRIVGATNTFSKLPSRWCSNHADFFPGHITWANFSAKYNLLWYSALVDGGGPEHSLSASPLSVCPANKSDAGLAGKAACSAIRVDGEPCDPEAAATDINNGGGRSTCLGKSKWGYLQDAAPGDYFQVDGEVLRLLVKTDDAHWTVQRDAMGRGPAAHKAGAPIHTICSGGTVGRPPNQLQFNGSIWWDFVGDPHGDRMRDDSIFTLGHRVYRPNMYVEGGQYVRAGTIPESIGAPPTAIVSMEPKFAGAGAPGQPDFVQEHESLDQFPHAPESEKRWFMDGKAIIGGGLFGGTPAQVAGANQVFRYSPGEYGSRPDWVSLARKQTATLMTCGPQPLVDISGPGSRLPDGPAGQYRYCVAAKPGECRDGSSAGELYFNCPYLQTLGCTMDEGALDTCAADQGAFAGGVSQQGVAAPDPTGALGRRLTMALNRYRMYDVYWNAKPLPDASWALTSIPLLGGVREEVVVFKLPPYPEPDGFKRNDFIPMVVKVPAGRADNVVVEFGYAENGDPASLYCTSRRETCVKGANPGNDYGFAGDATPGVPCATGCTVSVPALSQRMLYYRVVYRNRDNGVESRGGLSVAPVP